MLLYAMLTVYTVIVALSLYACLRLIKREFPHHATVSRALFSVCFLMLSAAPICGALIKSPSISAALRRTGNLWLNFGLYILIGVLFFGIIDLFFRRHHKKDSGKRGISWKRVTVLITVVVLLIAYGMVHVGQIKTVSYEVNKSGENSESLRIAFAADMHLGCQIGIGQLTKMVNAINDMDPDIVLIGGDIFDSDYDMLRDPTSQARALRQIKSRYGVYGVYGNPY